MCKWWGNGQKSFSDPLHSSQTSNTGAKLRPQRARFNTHSVYRQGSDFLRVIENAKSYIGGGGVAQWNYLVFKHNENQVMPALNMARDLQFSFFQLRRSGRFFDFSRLKEMDSYPILNREGAEIGKLQPAAAGRLKNPSIEKVRALTDAHGSFQNFLDKQKISCDSLNGKKLSISAEGLVLPCTFLYEKLYDLRFREASIAPFPPLDSKGRPRRDFENLFSKNNPEDLSLRHRSLEEILNSKIFDEIAESWSRASIAEGRLFQCSYTCGIEYKSCFDQPLNIDLHNPEEWEQTLCASMSN